MLNELETEIHVEWVRNRDTCWMS